jgi:replicative DNA helicase
MTDVAEQVTEHAAQHNLGYERIVLGSMLSSTTAIGEVQAIGLEAGEFVKPAHQALFTAICDAANAGRPTEPVALTGQLADTGQLATVGGGRYLLELLEAVPVAAQAPWYAQQIRDLATRRDLLAAVARVNQAAHAGADAERLAAIAETVIRAAAPRGNDVGMVSLGDFARIGTADIEMRKDRAPGLSTGLHDLDEVLGGLRPGQLVVFAARPGQGKSTIALDAARRTSIRDHRVTAYFTMEMTTQEMFDRCLSAESGVPYERIRDGVLDEWDWHRAMRALGPMSEAPLFFDDSTGQTLTRIRNRCRKVQARCDLDLVVLDYLQLIRGAGRVESRQQEVAQVTRGVKEMAGELQVPVIALVQLNRGPEQRTDKAPHLADMRDSGEIEQAANVVVMIHREDAYDPESPRSGEADLYIRKNRGGRQDVVTVAAQLHVCRFQSLAAA